VFNPYGIIAPFESCILIEVGNVSILMQGQRLESDILTTELFVLLNECSQLSFKFLIFKDLSRVSRVFKLGIVLLH
jgi:hypothetical protein